MDKLEGRESQRKKSQHQYYYYIINIANKNTPRPASASHNIDTPASEESNESPRKRKERSVRVYRQSPLSSTLHPKKKIQLHPPWSHTYTMIEKRENKRMVNGIVVTAVPIMRCWMGENVCDRRDGVRTTAGQTVG